MDKYIARITLKSAERIDPRDPDDVRYWAAALGVRLYELREAVDRVGTLRAAVERELTWAQINRKH